jgi:uncharacterized protein (TIGR00297 family)
VTAIPAAEWKRKAVHVGSGLFAFLLPFLTWRQAALAALAALAFNLLVLPRLGGRALLRKEEAGRTHSLGIVLYPAVVLALVLLFRGRLEIAAAGWAFLAFGDGAATLAGMALAGPRLPWNRGKSAAGLGAYVLFGGASAAVLYALVRGSVPSAGEITCLFGAALVGAAAESLPSEVDDNLLAPLMGAGALAALLAALPGWPAFVSGGGARRALVGLILNAAVAGLAGALRIVRPSGALAGFAFGTAIWAFGGARAYALLWLFFLAGTLATRFGRKRKEAMGKAEEAGGRRGAANVFANVSVAAFCTAIAGVAPADAAAWRLASAAALATALMDTMGTEVGQAIRTPTVLLPDFRRVPPGTDGAVSVAGTAAGLAAAALVAAAASRLTWIGPFPAAALVVVAAAFGTVVESLLGREGAPWRVSNGHVLNFLNTLAGALVALLLASHAGGAA